MGLPFVLSVFRLVGRAVGRVVPFRSVPFRSVPSLALFFVSVSRLVRVGSWGGAPFFSARFLVPSCLAVAFVSRGAVLSSVPVYRLVGACRLACRSARRLAPAFRVSCRLVWSSRVIVSQGVSFHPIVLVASSVLPCPGPCLIERGVPVLSRRGYRAGRLVAMAAVACFALTHAVRLLGAVFPSSVSRRGVTWVVPVPVAAWRVHPRSPASSSQPHRFSFSVVSYRLFSSVGLLVGPFRLSGWASRFPCRARCRYQPRRGRGASRSHGVFALRYPYAPFLSAQFPHRFPITIIVGDVRVNRLTGHRGHRPFHTGHQRERNWQRQRGKSDAMTGDDGENERTSEVSEATGARHKRRRL